MFSLPLSSSPLLRKKEVICKVGHEERWSESEKMQHRREGEKKVQAGPTATEVSPPMMSGYRSEGVPAPLSHQVMFQPPIAPPVMPQTVSPAYYQPQQFFPAMLPPYQNSPGYPVQQPFATPPPNYPYPGPGGVPSTNSMNNMNIMPSPQPPVHPVPPRVSADLPDAAPKFGRRGHRVPSNGDEGFLWRLGLGVGQDEKAASMNKRKDEYRRELEEQIRDKEARALSNKRSRSEPEPHQAVSFTTPGERTGKSDHSYGKMRAYFRSEDDITRAREKEKQSKKLQDDLVAQIEERKRAKATEEEQRRLSDERWNMKYAHQFQQPADASAKRKDIEEVHREKAAENQIVQLEAAAALCDPKFAPLKKVYHHQKSAGEPSPRMMAPAPVKQSVHDEIVVGMNTGGGMVVEPPKRQQQPPPVQEVKVVEEKEAAPSLPSFEQQEHVAAPPPVYHTDVSPPHSFQQLNSTVDHVPHFKQLPLSKTDERTLNQERRIAALESALMNDRKHRKSPPPQPVNIAPVSSMRMHSAESEIHQLAVRNKARLHQLSMLSAKIEGPQTKGQTDDILRDFLALDTEDQVTQGQGQGQYRDEMPSEQNNKLVVKPTDTIERDKLISGLFTPIHPSSRTMTRNVHMRMKETSITMHGTLSGESMFIRSEAKPPKWLQDSDDEEDVTKTQKHELSSIPATADIDVDTLKTTFPLDSSVEFEGRPAVVAGHGATQVIIRIDGEEISVFPHQITVPEPERFDPTLKTPNETPIEVPPTDNLQSPDSVPKTDPVEVPVPEGDENPEPKAVSPVPDDGDEGKAKEDTCDAEKHSAVENSTPAVTELQAASPPSDEIKPEVVEVKSDDETNGKLAPRDDSSPPSQDIRPHEEGVGENVEEGDKKPNDLEPESQPSDKIDENSEVKAKNETVEEETQEHKNK